MYFSAALIVALHILRPSLIHGSYEFYHDCHLAKGEFLFSQTVQKSVLSACTGTVGVIFKH